MTTQIQLFDGAPAMDVIRLREIYHMEHRIFAEPDAMELLKRYIMERGFDGTIIDQYIELQEQFDYLLQQTHLEKHVSLDDLDDFEGLPKRAEDKLRELIKSTINAKEKDQLLRKCLQEIQTELKTEVISTKSYKIFKSDIKKALEPYRGV